MPTVSGATAGATTGSNGSVGTAAAPPRSTAPGCRGTRADAAVPSPAASGPSPACIIAPVIPVADRLPSPCSTRGTSLVPPCMAHYPLDQYEPGSVLGVSLTRTRAPPLVTALLQAYAGAADPTQPLGRDPRDQGMVGHVPDHDRAGRHESPPPDRHRRHADRPGTDRRALRHRDSHALPVLGGLQPTVRVHRPGVQVVGEDRRRTDEDAVAKDRRLVDQRVVLELAAVAESGTGTDVRPSADHALAADRRPFADLREVPHDGARAHAGAWIDVGRAGDGRWILCVDSHPRILNGVGRSRPRSGRCRPRRCTALAAPR